MNALERLIAAYRAVNGFVASDGYEDRDEDEVVAAARQEREELIRALGRVQQDINWMLNGGQFLNADAFEYLETALAKHAPATKK